METKESIDFMAKTSISESDFEKSASSRDTAGNSSFKLTRTLYGCFARVFVSNRVLDHQNPKSHGQRSSEITESVND